MGTCLFGLGEDRGCKARRLWLFSRGTHLEPIENGAGHAPWFHDNHGGRAAKWYAEPANIEDLSTLVEACNFFDIQRAMIGRGSNLIVPDQGFAGLVIRLRGEFWRSIDLPDK